MERANVKENVKENQESTYLSIIEAEYAKIPEATRQRMLKMYGSQIKGEQVQQNIYLPKKLVVVLGFFGAYDNGISDFHKKLAQEFAERELAPRPLALRK